MTPRWRAVLRVRMLLRLLLEEHVPLGALSRCVADVLTRSDRELPDEQRKHADSMTGALARDLVTSLIDEDRFEPRRAVDYVGVEADSGASPNWRQVRCAGGVTTTVDSGVPLSQPAPRLTVGGFSYVPPAFFNLASLHGAALAVAALPEGSLTEKQRCTIVHVLGQASAERVVAGERLDENGDLVR